MYKTSELITNILDNPNIDSNYIDSIINYDICNMFISLLEETQNIHNSIKEEYIKKTMEKEISNKYNEKISTLNHQIKMEQSMVENYKSQIYTLKEEYKNLRELEQKNMNTILDRNMREKKEQIEFIQKQYIDIINSKDIEIQNLREDKNKSNYEKGSIGEKLVFNALCNLDKYVDLDVIETSNLSGNGDLLVKSIKHNINMLIEVKNQKSYIPKTQLDVFIDHYKEYFRNNIDSHAILFSINYNRITGKGSYKIDTISIDNKKHYVMYVADKNMTEDKINHHFCSFIDYINNHNDTTTINNLSILKKLENNNKLFQEQINYMIMEKKTHQEKISYIDNIIKNLYTNIEENHSEMEKHNYMNDMTSTQIIHQLKQIFIDDDINIYDISNFKKNFKNTYKFKKNFIEKYPIFKNILNDSLDTIYYKITNI
tara:strand:- start:302 stop:1588 length:1287 start_codon:yes stop_codon:yes gene_type:complete